MLFALVALPAFAQDYRPLTHRSAVVVDENAVFTWGTFGTATFDLVTGELLERDEARRPTSGEHVDGGAWELRHLPRSADGRGLFWVSDTSELRRTKVEGRLTVDGQDVILVGPQGLTRFSPDGTETHRDLEGVWGWASGAGVEAFVTLEELWVEANGEELCRSERPYGEAAIAIDPSGRWLATQGAARGVGGWVVWDAQDCTILGSVIGATDHAVFATRLGEPVLVGANPRGLLRVWELPDLSLVASHESPVHAVEARTFDTSVHVSHDLPAPTLRRPEVIRVGDELPPRREGRDLLVVVGEPNLMGLNAEGVDILWLPPEEYREDLDWGDAPRDVLGWVVDIEVDEAAAVEVADASSDLREVLNLEQGLAWVHEDGRLLATCWDAFDCMRTLDDAMAWNNGLLDGVVHGASWSAETEGTQDVVALPDGVALVTAWGFVLLDRKGRVRRVEEGEVSASPVAGLYVRDGQVHRVRSGRAVGPTWVDGGHPVLRDGNVGWSRAGLLCWFRPRTMRSLGCEPDRLPGARGRESHVDVALGDVVYRGRDGRLEGTGWEIEDLRAAAPVGPDAWVVGLAHPASQPWVVVDLEGTGGAVLISETRKRNVAAGHGLIVLWDHSGVEVWDTDQDG